MLKKTALSLLLFTTSIILPLAVFKYAFQVSWLHNTLWYIVSFVFVLTAISLLLGLKGVRESQEAVVKYVMGATLIRLTLSIIAIYVALKIGVSERLTFVLNFMTVYLVFLAFELYSLLTTLRPH
ncbi:MAG: hypothetical protein AAF632_15415 [Bacteroidota bacterium]